MKYLVILNPDFGFVAINGEFSKYRGFDLSEASFIQCTTLEDIEYVQSLDRQTLSFSPDAVAAFPFGAQVVEAKDLIRP